MDLMQVFHQACGEFPQFRSQIVHARNVTPDPGIRAQLDQVLASLDKSFADFKQTFPRAADDVKQTLASADAKANEASQMLAAAKQKRAEFTAALKAEKASAAAAEPPAVAKPSPLDLIFAAQLRQELLDRFTGWRKLAGEERRFDHEIWEDWEDG
jgi:hypothetical protein